MMLQIYNQENSCTIDYESLEVAVKKLVILLFLEFQKAEEDDLVLLRMCFIEKFYFLGLMIKIYQIGNGIVICNYATFYSINNTNLAKGSFIALQQGVVCKYSEC